MADRWVVRVNGGSKGPSWVWRPVGSESEYSHLSRRRDGCYVFTSRDEADVEAERFGGRVVRLLSADQAKKKAAATALRALADRWELETGHRSDPFANVLKTCIEDTRGEAEKLWPQRKASR